MCGIHGFITQRIGSDEGQKLIRSMVNSTNHRGPDFSNVFQIDNCYLGHNRLSILDLSESGNQPMQYNHFTIVFNGEIYNYKELRNELIKNGYSFNSESDTEVVLKGYEYWGENMVSKFLGMWSFAIYNTISKELFCSRDRFGIKPFYYCVSGKEFYFASEIKSLKITPVFSKELNLNQVSKGLQLGWVGFKNETYFEHVNALEPGHSMVISSEGVLKKKAYWEIHTGKTHKEDSLQTFQELFQDSLGLHMRSDVPVGATLSGGLDSSSIVCSILEKELAKDLHTFSIYYQGTNAVDERPFIYEIEKKYPTKFHAHYYSPSPTEIASDFHSIAETMDVPLSGSSAISQYYVMKMVKEAGVKVVLSGQGADDYMGGYLHGFYRFFADKFTSLEWVSLSKEFSLYKQFQEASWGKMTNVALKSLMCVFLSEKYLYRMEYEKYLPFLMNKKSFTSTWNLPDFTSSKLDNFHFALMNYSSLPTLLHYEDRNSMAHSVESRVPFLDHRIVELLFASSSSSKINDGYTKKILRDSMDGILPKTIQYRKDKKGFVTPGEVVWLRGCLSHLLELDFDLMHFLNKEKTIAVIEDFKKGNNKFAKLVWRVACLNYWLKNTQ